jgi:hypothetical protein
VGPAGAKENIASDLREIALNLTFKRLVCDISRLTG